RAWPKPTSHVRSERRRPQPRRRVSRKIARARRHSREYPGVKLEAPWRWRWRNYGSTPATKLTIAVGWTPVSIDTWPKGPTPGAVPKNGWGRTGASQEL